LKRRSTSCPRRRRSICSTLLRRATTLSVSELRGEGAPNHHRGFPRFGPVAPDP
jgi:hypothetical protein